MISLVQPLSVGNALRLILQPPAGAVRWKVLRKTADDFSGHDDGFALVVHEGDERVIVDTAHLPNEQMQFYRPFYTSDGVTWTAGPTNTGTALPTMTEVSNDVQSFVRDRLEAGLKVECDKGALVTELGYVQVFTAPPSMEQGVRFPVVTVLLEGDAPAHRAIGEDIVGDTFDQIGDEWVESEGWLSQTQLSITGWSLNPDERVALRQALRRLILGNRPVFSAHGLDLIEFHQTDSDAIGGEFDAPLYLTSGTFSCVAPVTVSGRVDPVRTIIARSTHG